MESLTDGASHVSFPGGDSLHRSPLPILARKSLSAVSSAAILQGSKLKIPFSHYDGDRDIALGAALTFHGKVLAVPPFVWERMAAPAATTILSGGGSLPCRIGKKFLERANLLPENIGGERKRKSDHPPP